MGALTLACTYVGRVFRFLLDFSTSLFFGLIYGKPKPIPPIRNDILLQPAIKLAEKIRKKQLKSVEVLEAYMSRIVEVQPLIKAVVDERFEQALSEAQAADELIASGKKTEDEIAKNTPFLGVPISVKEPLGVTGMSLTCGITSRKNIKSDGDADVVKLVKASGAIPIVATNIPELCMWFECGNNVYGTTNNPYDTRRTPGGSSGGEGALIASAGSVAGIGSDIGGSIRIPAAMCGIYGHKPTGGVVPNMGTFAVLPESVLKFSVKGPMCRYVTDLLPLMKVMTKNLLELHLDKPVDLKQLKIYYIEELDNPMIAPVVYGLKGAIRKAVSHFEEKYNVKTQKIHIEHLDISWSTCSHAFQAVNLPPFSKSLSIASGKENINLIWEGIKLCFGFSDHTFHALFYAMINMYSRWQSSKEQVHKNALKKHAELHEKFKEILQENCVLLLPCQPGPAPFHYETVFNFLNLNYTLFANAFGIPSTSIPVGLYKGLPIGIQCVAGNFNDRLTIAVAEEIDKIFGGWTAPGPIM